MKKIEAIIRPEKFEDLKDVLQTLPINGLSISQISGFGKQKGWKEFVRGVEVDLNFLPKMKLEMVVADEAVEEIIAMIRNKTATGEVGDGKIFVSAIEDAIRIRTGERGMDAIK
ncbi:MAG: P-II family nitrogen regulator [Anaerofustis sp.]